MFLNIQLSWKDISPELYSITKCDHLVVRTLAAVYMDSLGMTSKFSLEKMVFSYSNKTRLLLWKIRLRN